MHGKEWETALRWGKGWCKVQHDERVRRLIFTFKEAKKKQTFWREVRRKSRTWCTSGKKILRKMKRVYILGGVIGKTWQKTIYSSWRSHATRLVCPRPRRKTNRKSQIFLYVLGEKSFSYFSKISVRDRSPRSLHECFSQPFFLHLVLI